MFSSVVNNRRVRNRLYKKSEMFIVTMCRLSFNENMKNGECNFLMLKCHVL